MLKQLWCSVCQGACGKSSQTDVLAVCSSTHDDTSRTGSSVASLLTYPPYIAPVPPPPVPLFAGVLPPAGVPPLAGVPPPAGVPPLAGGVPTYTGVSFPASLPGPVVAPLPGGGRQPAGVTPPVGVPPPARAVPTYAGGVPAPAGGVLTYRGVSDSANVSVQGGDRQPASVPPPVGVPPPTGGVPPPTGGVPPPVGVAPPTGGVPPPAGAVPTYRGVSVPASVSLPVGGRQPTAAPPPASISMPGGPPPAGGPLGVGGISQPAGVPGPINAPLHVGGTLPSGGPPPMGGPLGAGVISQPAGVSQPINTPLRVGGTLSTGGPPPVPAGGPLGIGGVSQPINAPLRVGGILPSGGPPLSAGVISQPAAVSQPINAPLRVGGPLSTGGPPPAGGPLPLGVPRPTGISSLPPPRFMSGFDLSVPPPALNPPVASTAVSLSTELSAVVPAPRPAEDMELDNSASSEEDVGEGFDEEWPICSRRISSRSRDSSQHPSFVREKVSRLGEYQTSGSNFHDHHSLPDRHPVQSDDYGRTGAEPPQKSRMYDTSLPVSGNNFDISSPFVDRINPLATSVAAVGGPGLVRSQLSCVPAAMDRARGSVNPASGSVVTGLSDVDFRTSHAAAMVPVGPTPLSAPMKMVPPPLPPLTRPPVPGQHLPGAVRPFSESSLPMPDNASAGIGAGGIGNPFAGMDTSRDVLGPRLAGVAYPGSVGMLGNPPPVVSGLRNMPGAVRAGSSTAGVPAMETGTAVRGPSDVPVGPRFPSPLPANAFEHAGVRPPNQQVFMQGNMNPNPGMMPVDVGPVRGQIPGSGQVIGTGLVGSGNVEVPSNFRPPLNAGNVASLRGPTEFGGVVRNVVPPDSVQFGVQHDIPRLQGTLPCSLPPTLNKPMGPVPQIPAFPGGPVSGQFPAVSVEQNASSSGPSERVLNALHSLAGMQTDDAAHDGRATRPVGIDTRFTDSLVQTIDAGMGQTAPGLNKTFFGPQADVGRFGSPAFRSLLPQQNRPDGVGPSLPHGGFPAPPRLGIGQPQFPLSGNIHSFFCLVCLSSVASIIVIIDSCHSSL